ncbi:MAG: V-type ATP synthase subunit D, partial [Treponema sp.]|nr:V-type ATP synthase subunit D [Treponema sp.]
LVIARDGHNLLEQKREILVMELMRIVEKIKLLEREIQKSVEKAYPSLRSMLMTVGEERIDRISHGIKYDFSFVEKSVTVAGMHFKTLDVNAPKQKLFYSFLGTYSDSDKVIVEFFKLLNLLTQMASIRTIAWRLAMEVKKAQRRVNALSKLVIPQTDDTRKYIEGVLEERERENTFTLKSLKNRK